MFLKAHFFRVLENLPSLYENDYHMQIGFPVGKKDVSSIFDLIESSFQTYGKNFYIYNHLTFKIDLDDHPDIKRVVGFSVIPRR